MVSFNPVFSFIFVVLITAFGAVNVSAQEAAKKPAEKTPAAAWQVNCSPTSDPNILACQMVQNLTLAKTGQRLLTVVIKPQPKHEKKEPAIVLSLPHGLFLPAGVSLQVDDGKKTTLAVRTSDKNGAYTATALNKDFVTALKAGNVLKVTMTANNKKPVAVSVSLIGFTAAFNKIGSGS